MPKVQEHPGRPEGGKKYGAFQSVKLLLQIMYDYAQKLTMFQEIYQDGLLRNKVPTVTTDPNKLEDQARHHLGARSYNYVAGGAGEKATMDANRLAFRQWKVRPPSLADVLT